VDLSVGSVLTLSAAVGATVMAGMDSNIFVAIVASLAIGAVVGAINGAFVAFRNVSSFIFTLGMATFIQGAELLFTGGTARGILSPHFVDAFGGTPLLGIPTVAVILLLVFAAALLLEKLTVFGRHVFLVGSNPRAAELGGVPVNRTLVVAYVLSGMAAGLAGVVVLARIGVSSAYVGQGYDFLALAMVVLGGTTFQGGRGGVSGTLAGILILTVAFQLVNIIGLTFYVQLIVEGAIIVCAAGAYRILQRRS
jgi:ribose transport system permease protein